MPECDLDDNDPFYKNVKKAPMVGVPSTFREPTQKMSVTLSPLNDNKADSVTKIRQQRSENINHDEIDNENDKVKETEVSKQMDYRE